MWRSVIGGSFSVHKIYVPFLTHHNYNNHTHIILSSSRCGRYIRRGEHSRKQWVNYLKLMASLIEPESPSPDIYIPKEWSEAADSIAYDSVTSPPPIALVCGAKNCGKTTFSRSLLNILLQRSVCWTSKCLVFLSWVCFQFRICMQFLSVGFNIWYKYLIWS